MVRLTFPRVVVVAAISLPVLLVATPAFAAPGDLDPSFGTGGVVTTALSSGAFAAGVGLAPNGDVVAAGTESTSTGSRFAVVEYRPNGNLDHHFGGGDGIATVSFGSCTQATGMAIDSQGRIVVVGFREPCGTGTSVIAIARFRSDGTLDPTFSAGNGKKVVALAGRGEEGTSVAMDGSRIVVAGEVQPKGQGSTVFLFLRLNDDGTLDHSFSGDGLAFVRFGDSNSAANAVAIESNHKIVACGYEETTTHANDYDFAVARLSPSGPLDTSFNSDGRATVGFSSGSDRCFGVATDSGKFVLGGITASGSGDVALARLTSAGHLDTSFGAGGRTVTSLSSGFDWADGVAADGSGRIVAAGAKNADRFAVLRYMGNGHLDQSFGTGGITATKIKVSASASGLVLGNGTVVLAGQTETGGGVQKFAVARYKA